MPFNRLNHSILGAIKPRFSLQIDCEPEKAVAHLKSSITKDESVITLKKNFTQNLVFITIPYREQHYWSPEITVRIEKSEYEEHTKVACLIGPKQSVWAMFTFIYAFLSIVSVFGGMFGLVDYQTNGNTFFLWFFPVGVMIMISFFIVSKLGQQKGRDQMLHLVSFVYHSLAEITDVKRVEG